MEVRDKKMLAKKIREVADEEYTLYVHDVEPPAVHLAISTAFTQFAAALERDI